MTSRETAEEVLTRHRKEVKDLMAETTGMKKQATKGEKKKKKEILKQIDQMEKDLKSRHDEEKKALESNGVLENKPSNGNLENGKDETEQEEVEEEEVTAEMLLAQLEKDLQQQKLEDSSKPKSEPAKELAAQAQPGKKRNRRKEKLAQRQEEIRKISQQAQLEASLQPDLRQIEQENIDMLCKVRHLIPFEVNADGHCLFAAIADQLQQRLQIASTVSELRKQAANYIRQNPDTFVPFLFDETTFQTREIESYCEELESTAMWGGDLEILALSKVYSVCISVMVSGASSIRVNEEGEKPELFLVYYKHSYGLGEHYNSLRDIKGGDAKEDSKET